MIIFAKRCSCILLLLLAGCEAFVPSLQPTLSTQPPSVTVPSLPPSPTATLTTQPVPTASQSPTATATATRTPTATATASLTPLPTLSTAEYQQLIAPTHLMRAKCALPFWGAITPGLTSWAEADQFIKSLKGEYWYGYNTTYTLRGQDYPVRGYDLMIRLNDQLYGIGTLIRAQEEVAAILILPDETTSECRLDQILSMYGPPDEVYLKTLANPPEPDYLFFLVVVYQEQGFAASFEYQFSRAGEMLRVCPGAQGPVMVVWGESDDYIQARGELQEVLFGPDSRPMKPLQATTELTIEQFYAQFRDPAAGTCLETGAEHW